MKQVKKNTLRTFQEKANARHLNLNESIKKWNCQNPCENSTNDFEENYWLEYLAYTSTKENPKSS